jgi:hypothetical protein
MPQRVQRELKASNGISLAAARQRRTVAGRPLERLVREEQQALQHRLVFLRDLRTSAVS